MLWLWCIVVCGVLCRSDVVAVVPTACANAKLLHAPVARFSVVSHVVVLLFTLAAFTKSSSIVLEMFIGTDVTGVPQGLRRFNCRCTACKSLL